MIGLLCSLSMAFPVSGQTTLVVSETLNGILEAEQTASFTWEPNTEAGYVITITSEEFVPQLVITDAGEAVIARSETTVGTAVQVVAVPRTAGTHTIRVSSADALGAGKYRLLVEPIVSTPIAVGESVEAQVDDQQFFTLSLQADQLVSIQLASNDFDPVLSVRDANGREIAQDDDGGRGLNAYLIFRAPQTDTYLLKAAVLGEIVGTFLLRVDALAPHPMTDLAVDGEPTTTDAERAGTLAESTAQWSVELGQGEKLIVEAESADFDTYLSLRTADGFAELAFDDDGGAGVNARLIYTNDFPNTYQLRLSGVQGNPATGAYRVRAFSGVPAVDGRFVGLAVVEAGTLEIDQPSAMRLDDAVARYDFKGRAGDVVFFDLESETFDAFLVVLDAADAPIAQDDDGGEATNAALAITFPEDGTYTVVVASFGGAATGAYTLTASQSATP